jgi:glycerophosphodiester phosphodiesterase
VEVQSPSEHVSDPSAHYINYKALKKQIKSAQIPSADAIPDESQSPDLTGSPLHVLLTIAFFFELDRNVEVVEDFFSKKSADIQRRLKSLIDRYGENRTDMRDAPELEDLVCSICHLINTRSAL